MSQRHLKRTRRRKRSRMRVKGWKPDDKEKKKENGPAPKLSLNLGGIADDMQDGLGGIGGGLGSNGRRPW